jgi:hypothetical protein
MKTKSIQINVKNNNLLVNLYITDTKYNIFEKKDFIKKRNFCEIFYNYNNPICDNQTHNSFFIFVF